MPERSSSDMGAALSELAGLLVSTASFTDLLRGVAELAARSVPSVATCGITLSTDGRVLSAGSADDLAAHLDEQQNGLGTGPYLQAAATGEVVDAPDLSVETRWGDYPAVAMGHGMMSVLSTPLVVHGIATGALSLYARQSYAFDPHDRHLALLLASQAAVAMSGELRNHDQVTVANHLRAALASRSVIDQAIGIVMAQRHCDAGHATAALRTISQRRHIKLRTVASDLVTAMAPPAPTPQG